MPRAWSRVRLPVGMTAGGVVAVPLGLVTMEGPNCCSTAARALCRPRSRVGCWLGCSGRMVVAGMQAPSPELVRRSVRCWGWPCASSRAVWAARPPAGAGPGSNWPGVGDVVVVMRSGFRGSWVRSVGRPPPPRTPGVGGGWAGPPTPRWQPAAPPTSPRRSRATVLEPEDLGVEDAGDLLDHLAHLPGLLAVQTLGEAMEPVALPGQLVQPAVGHSDRGPQQDQAIQQLLIQGRIAGPRGLELVEQPRNVGSGVGDESRVRVVQAAGDLAGVRGADHPRGPHIPPGALGRRRDPPGDRQDPRQGPLGRPFDAGGPVLGHGGGSWSTWPASSIR